MSSVSKTVDRALPTLDVQSRAFIEGILEILTPIALLVAWGLWSSSADSFYFPPLVDIFREFANVWLFDGILQDLVPSLLRMAAGLSLAVMIGIGLGIPLGLSKIARSGLSPIVEFLRAIPAPALIPFLIVMFGIGTEMKVIVIAFGCVWPILLGTIDGIIGLDATMADTASVYGVRGAARVRRVVIPSASPQIFSALRQSVALALILVVVSEMAGSSDGVGHFVLQAQRQFAIPEMWSGILLLGILGYVLNALFVAIERRALAWHRGAKESILR